MNGFLWMPCVTLNFNVTLYLVLVTRIVLGYNSQRGYRGGNQSYGNQRSYDSNSYNQRGGGNHSRNYDNNRGGNQYSNFQRNHGQNDGPRRPPGPYRDRYETQGSDGNRFSNYRR